MPENSATCHCGAITLSWSPSFDLADTPTRTCGCSFCLRHDPVYFADPQSEITLTCDEDCLTRYRFGQKTADFLICKSCGCFLGAVAETSAGQRGVFNARGFQITPLLERSVAIADYENEDMSTRNDRRARNWSPVVFAAPA